MQRNSYGAYGIFVTATAKRQRQNGNGRVETRHYSATEAVSMATDDEMHAASSSHRD